MPLKELALFVSTLLGLFVICAVVVGVFISILVGIATGLHFRLREKFETFAYCLWRVGKRMDEVLSVPHHYVYRLTSGKWKWSAPDWSHW